MGYWNELRKLVGTRALILPGAEVIVLNQCAEVLLVRRADNGLWAIPGGMMELGERFEDTARRETEEESGIIVDELELLGVFSGQEFFYRYPHGDEVYNASAAYVCRKWHGELRTDEEGLEVGFYPLDNPPGEIIFLNRLVLDAFQNKQQK